MKQIFLSIGSNLSNPQKQVKLALDQIAKINEIFEFKASRLYRTKPISPIPQEDFINAACSFQTTLPLRELHSALIHIEKSLGKVKKHRDAPRLIDIDILLFGDLYLQNELILPHPRMLERLFVIGPLLELTDSIVYPIGPSTHQVLYLKSIYHELSERPNQQIVPILSI